METALTFGLQKSSNGKFGIVIQAMTPIATTAIMIPPESIDQAIENLVQLQERAKSSNGSIITPQNRLITPGSQIGPHAARSKRDQSVTKP